MPDENEIIEHATGVVETIIEDAIVSSEIHVDVLEHALDDANARAAAAEETAALVAEAAMETERGLRLENLEGKFFTWQNEQQQEMSGLKSAMESLLSQMQNLSLSTLPVSEAVLPTTTEPEIVEAQTVTNPLNAVADVLPVEEEPQPVTAQAKRKRRWI